MFFFGVKPDLKSANAFSSSLGVGIASNKACGLSLRKLIHFCHSSFSFSFSYL
jgi:hypothetical protein